MSVQVSIEVDGMADALAHLKDVDPELRKQVVKAMKSAAAPAQRNVRGLLPNATPLSNWGTWPRGLGYDGSKAKRGVKISHRAKARPGRTIPVVAIKSTDAGAMIYDMAGRTSPGKTAQARAFIRNLNRLHGRASRSVWPGVTAAMPEIERGIDQAVEMTGRTISRKAAT